MAFLKGEKEMIQFKKSATALLALTMLVGCGGGNGGTSTGGSTGSESGSDTPLVVGYSPFNSKFSPFFATTGYDQVKVLLFSMVSKAKQESTMVQIILIKEFLIVLLLKMLMVL